MTDTTTIQVTRETKALIDERKLGGESYDTAIRRLAEDSGFVWTQEEIREVVREELNALN